MTVNQRLSIFYGLFHGIDLYSYYPHNQTNNLYLLYFWLLGFLIYQHSEKAYQKVK